VVLIAGIELLTPTTFAAVVAGMGSYLINLTDTADQALAHDWL
jgi:hypothetical protein